MNKKQILEPVYVEISIDEAITNNLIDEDENIDIDYIGCYILA